MENNKLDTIIHYVNNVGPDGNSSPEGNDTQAPVPQEEYAVTGICIGCGKCLYVCPEDCIVHDGVPYYIDAHRCRSCGNCREVCPVGAVSVL